MLLHKKKNTFIHNAPCRMIDRYTLIDENVFTSKPRWAVPVKWHSASPYFLHACILLKSFCRLSNLRVIPRLMKFCSPSEWSLQVAMVTYVLSAGQCVESSNRAAHMGDIYTSLEIIAVLQLCEWSAVSHNLCVCNSKQCISEFFHPSRSLSFPVCSFGFVWRCTRFRFVFQSWSLRKTVRGIALQVKKLDPFVGVVWSISGLLVAIVTTDASRDVRRWLSLWKEKNGNLFFFCIHCDMRHNTIVLYVW